MNIFKANKMYRVSLKRKIILSWPETFTYDFFFFCKKIYNHAYTAQKMKFSIKNFFSKCDQIRRCYCKSYNSFGFNPILQKSCEMICEIIFSKTVRGIFCIFCRSRFINSFVVKNIFLKP